jgi:CTP synthase
VCGLEEANTAENDPTSPQLVIDFMPEQKTISMMGATMRLGAHKIIISRESLAYSLYGAEEIYERHRHRYEVNPEYRQILEKSGLVFSGKSIDGRRMEILELPEKSFFFASQYHGEFQSRPGKPDPEYYGFVKACLERKRKIMHLHSPKV